MTEEDTFGWVTLERCKKGFAGEQSRVVNYS